MDFNNFKYLEMGISALCT